MNIGIRDALAYFGDSSVTTVHKAMGLLAIVYVISPVDIVSDIVPLLGWLDDVGVIALVAAFYMRQIPQHRSKALPQTIDVHPVRS